MARTKRKRREEIVGLGRERFGFEELHPGQLEAIEAVLDGQDTLAIMPTGAGKSAIYQIADLMLDGPTVIISPLIALQHDQAEAIEANDLGEAAEVNSAAGKAARKEAFAELAEHELEFLFIAPEQFNNPKVLERLRAAKPSLVVVDEAHAVSEWGHDFRPEYLRVGAVTEAIGRPPILALTATASPLIRDDVLRHLHMKDPKVISSGFDRPNIFLSVEKFQDESAKREAVFDRVTAAEKPGIVYAATHRHVEELAENLRKTGAKVGAYHGGLSSGERTATQDAFMNDDLEVIVATNAFGLGIDKRNVRFVYHYDVSDSLDSYYQEIGRAGRDEEPAEAVLFYRGEDLGLRHFFAGIGKVDVEQVEKVEEAIDRHEEPLDLKELHEATGLSKAKVVSAVTNLEEVGAVETLATGEIVADETPESRHDLAEEAVEIEERHRELEQSRLEMMRGYAEVYDCRRGYLLNYFGEPLAEPCGFCDNCRAGITVAEDTSRQPFPLNSRVSHAVWGEGQVQRYEGDTMTVAFDEVGYKTLDVDFVVESGALKGEGEDTPGPLRHPYRAR
ncbi:MAG: RecQ family ATP-dependent DNA helicase [Chloroflexota bacterium]